MENLMEEREELMVSMFEEKPKLKKTHFLKPYVTAIDDQIAELPSQRLSDSSLDVEELSSRASFSGFWFAERRFISWAKKMEALHEPIWKKAGIFEAIKASTYNISKNPSLILTLAQKWCPDTKSFIFPWGEVTITLEDVMILLGFSVLGSPVFTPLESSEMKKAVEKLGNVRLESRRRTDSRVSQTSWASKFMNKGDQIEHEAFLVLWLSIFVFPEKSRPSISRTVLPIAVRLARGDRLALAPCVLANLYKDLGTIHDFSRQKCHQKINLRSLFKLLQVWTWERFKNTIPTKPKEIPKGEPRIAQWDNLPKKSDNNRLVLDDFEWRPYTKPLKNWSPFRVYVEEAMWLKIDENVDDEFVSFARCVRVSQLVGNGFVEDYLPNRVAMQFGLAQDLPGLVITHSNFTEKEAWDDYSKSLDGLNLYMPSRLTNPYVTVRYRDWWTKSVSKFTSSSKILQKDETFDASNTIDHYDDDDDVCPKIVPLSDVLQKLPESSPVELNRSRTQKLGQNLRSKVKKDKGEGSKDRFSKRLKVGVETNSNDLEVCLEFGSVDVNGDENEEAASKKHESKSVESNVSYEEKLQKLKLTAISVEGRILKLQRLMAEMKQRKARQENRT